MIVAIIQARTGSTRLPGKVLKDILGRPMLAWQIERLKLAKKIDKIVVATTVKPEDDPVVAIAKECNVGSFRGSEPDVLDRFYGAAKQAGATIVLRLTGDCPFTDPEVVDELVENYLKNHKKIHYTGTPTNYPEGLDTEIFPFSALETAWKNAILPSEREHVTPYIKNHPELFNCQPWKSGKEDYSSMHWSVDSPQDFIFATKVFEALAAKDSKKIFHKDDVLKLLEKQPQLLEINRGGTGYEGYAKSVKEDQEFLKKRKSS